IDLVFHGTPGALEYDFVVAPRADPRRISVRFVGADALRIDAQGGLALRTAQGEVAFRRPVAYQDVDGTRREVGVRYVRRGGNEVGFAVGRYDRARPLVIDPVLALSSNLWGTATGVALDSGGNIYVTGSVWTSDLPVAGGYQTQQVGTQDAYVLKLNPAGTSAIYTTYLGARRATTQGLGIAVDADGSAYVTGTTTSTSFPITAGAYQSTGTSFVTKLKPAGNALAYSTLFGAPVAAIAVHGDGSLAITGTTSVLTTTAGALQASKLGATAPYVARLNALGTGMAYATWLGGSAKDDAHGIAVDGAGNAYVVGTARSSNFPTRNPLRPALGGMSDAYVAKINPGGTDLVYSTYLGGSADERGFAISVDASGRASVVGWTTSANFPVTPGVFQPYLGAQMSGVSNAFVAKLDGAGASLAWASYLGGAWCVGSGASSCFGIFGADEGIDVATSVATDAAGFTYVGGYATSTLFPQRDPVQDLSRGGDVQRAPFVARIRPGGSGLVYSTALGSRTSSTSVDQIAVDGQGGVVAVGSTPGELFPLTGGAVLGPGHSFMFGLATGGYPTTLRSSVNPAANAQPVVLSADVGAALPGGTVTFKAGADVLGIVPVVEGGASLGVTLPPGVHRVTAVNSVDGKVSPPLFQIVSGR
ncbi:MAG: SBBP repeat-containing protein, partial [Burkholderiales bacterium]